MGGYMDCVSRLHNHYSRSNVGFSLPWNARSKKYSLAFFRRTRKKNYRNCFNSSRADNLLNQILKLKTMKKIKIIQSILIATLLLITGSIFAQQNDWTEVEKIFGKKGNVQGDV